MKKYKALVVGCGHIGSIFGELGSKEILSHAQAYTSHPSFSLKGVVDIDLKTAKTAADKWKTAYFTSYEDAIKKDSYDIVSICVPTQDHAKAVRKIAASCPKVMVLEKPVTNNLDESEQLNAWLKNCKCQVLVHYTRRFMSEFNELKEKIQHGKFGKFISGHCYYSKGTLNNGSHAVDLMRYFLGKAQVISVFSGRIDFAKNDPTLSFAIGFKPRGVFCLLEADQRCGSIFEIELLFEKRLVRISEITMTIEEFTLQPDPLWKGHRRWALQKSAPIIFGNAFPTLLDHAIELLEGRVRSACSLSEGIASQRLCAEAIAKFKKLHHE